MLEMKRNLWVLTVLLSGAICRGVVVEPEARTEYEVVRNEVFLENAGGMPALCRAGNGELLFAHATYWEPVPTGGVIKLMRSSDEGRTWSKPTIVVRSKADDWNVTFWSGLHLMSDGSLILTYTQHHWPMRKDVPADWLNPLKVNPLKVWDMSSPDRKCEAYIIHSVDHGRTWSEPVRIMPENNCWAFGRPVNAKDGSVLVPLIPQLPDPIQWCSAVTRSCDNGKTWSKPWNIADGPVGYNEVTLGVAQNGDIVAIFRDAIHGPRRQFRQAISTDNGKTWPEPKLIEIWGKMPDILVLPSGRMLLAVGSLDCMDGSLAFKGPPNSTYAGLFISDDNGKTWKRDVLLVTPELENLIPFDVPVMTLLKNGNILTIFFAADRRYLGKPLSGWCEGNHYVINELAPTKKN